MITGLIIGGLAFCIQSLPQPTNPQTIVPAREQVTVNQRNGRNERIFVSLESVYPRPNDAGSELSFEELMASKGGWLEQSWKSEKLHPVKDTISKSTIQIFTGPEETLDIAPRQSQEKLVIPRDAVIYDENGAVKEPAKEGRGRRLRTVEVNETQISRFNGVPSKNILLTRSVKTKLSSPSGKKLKRKQSAEPTMTFHTKAATDEIYDLFNQPLKPAADEEDDEEEESEEEDDDDETDGDYTSGGESTGTGRLAASEVGDDETSDVKSVSEWSDFTARKHIPGLDDDDDDDEDDTRATHLTEDGEEHEGDSEDNADDEPSLPVPVNPQVPSANSDMVTPVFPGPSLPATRTMFVPIPPEDYIAPTRPYRDPSQVSQNRLPFMTPIAEKTESSLGANTCRDEKEYFNSKTPSKQNGQRLSIFRDTNDEAMSSPFQEIVNEAMPREKIPQPALGRGLKTNKTTAIAARVQASGGPLAKEIAPKGPIIKDGQCNPVDDYTRNMIFENLQPALSTYEGFFGHEESINKGAEIRKFAKAVSKMSKNSADKTATNISMPPILRFPGAERQYMIKKELGAGAFAPVYLIENVAEEVHDEDEEAAAVMGRGKFDHFGRRNLEALKMEDPPTAWEFYIMRQAKRRLGVSRAAESIINVYEMHLYQDECFLIEEYRDQGTLLDLVNIARADSTAAGGVMDECLVMFFAVELFRTVEALHAKGILHGDLKADNCLVRLDAVADTEVWSPRYRRDGTSGWNQKGVSLIDFGRGIDMKLFRPDVQFIADWKTSAQDCAEMRELRPWTYQIDYHGLAGIIHSMLFGKYIDTVADRATKLGAGATKIYKIKENLKRYWQQDIWSEVFDLLLNPLTHLEGEEGTRLPVLKGMKSVRERMEQWVEGSCEKGVGLQAGIRKLEYTLSQRRK
jgi:checkpoint serine/threonine-protein kinase